MLFIALRQMSARKLQTALTILGIVFGAMGYIVISGVMLGFRVYLLEQLVNSDAHIKIGPGVENIRPGEIAGRLYGEEIVFWVNPPGGKKDSSEIRNTAYWLRLLREDPDIEAFSRQLSTKVILKHGSQSEAARLVGVEPIRHSRVTNILDNMVRGNYTDLGESAGKLLMGEGLAINLGVKLYDTIFISAGFGRTFPFKVIGFFRSGNKALDDSVCYASLSDVQVLNRTPGKISGISIRLKDVSLVPDKTREWSGKNKDAVESWEETNASFLTIFKIQDTIRYSITIIILVVSGFGIYNILNILINQKKREIAILRSIGYEPGDILKIFLIQGLVLGVVGGLLGMFLGYIISYNLSTLRFSSPYLSTKTGRMLISFEPAIYFNSFFLALFATLFASILPARSAGKLEPIEIIRGEI